MSCRVMRLGTKAVPYFFCECLFRTQQCVLHSDMNEPGVVYSKDSSKICSNWEERCEKYLCCCLRAQYLWSGSSPSCYYPCTSRCDPQLPCARMYAPSSPPRKWRGLSAACAWSSTGKCRSLAVLVPVCEKNWWVILAAGVHSCAWCRWSRLRSHPSSLYILVSLHPRLLTPPPLLPPLCLGLLLGSPSEIHEIFLSHPLFPLLVAVLYELSLSLYHWKSLHIDNVNNINPPPPYIQFLRWYSGVFGGFPQALPSSPIVVLRVLQALQSPRSRVLRALYLASPALDPWVLWLWKPRMLRARSWHAALEEGQAREQTRLHLALHQVLAQDAPPKHGSNRVLRWVQSHLHSPTYWKTSSLSGCSRERIQLRDPLLCFLLQLVRTDRRVSERTKSRRVWNCVAWHAS